MGQEHHHSWEESFNCECGKEIEFLYEIWEYPKNIFNSEKLTLNNDEISRFSYDLALDIPDENDENKYHLSSKLLYHILKDKKIEHLYHANTVLTSLTFIEQESLLSRAYVENNNLNQTPQKSDKEDKKYNVWNDVFLDALDLHTKYSRPNKYGPILFVLNLDLLLSPYFETILITKTNPWYWKDSTLLSEKYYSNLEDVRNDYLSGEKIDAQIMFTFRNIEQKLNLKRYLSKIIIDKPSIIISLQSGIKKNVGDYASEAIEKALLKKNIITEIEVRHIGQNFFSCNCNLTYTILFNTDSTEFKKRFSIKG
ncbi:hypothetical protein Q763_07935 [Flavobacterium beibuense F44-8]|uniref:Uncharacterized protein n=2 Tax=Flavobacterium beibuense TaxID=657326 RepID=A0A0A2LZN2_9FLAO|nr:hypothetical protein Q763_07935 [Flavobacterium beibuense F44-8]